MSADVRDDVDAAAGAMSSSPTRVGDADTAPAVSGHAVGESWLGSIDLPGMDDGADDEE